MKELWQPVEGYEGLYEVSNQGRVRSLDREIQKRGRAGVLMNLRLRGKVLKPQMDGNVRLCVALSKNGKYKPFRIHAMVAHTFLGPRPTGLQINHIDGDCQNNIASNLEYCTASENMQHAVRLELIKPPVYRGGPTVEIQRDSKTGRFMSSKASLPPRGVS
jgi:hypothetical protein